MFRRVPSPALSCLLLGAVAATGFAPLQLWPLTLVCLAVWMAIVHAAPTMRQALWRGWLFGVGHFTVNDNWFQHAFDFQDKMPPVFGYFAAVGLALYLAVYPMMAAGLAWRYRGARADTGYVLVFGAAWIATEWLRAVTFTGYAWDPIGVVWVPVQAVAGIATLVGTYALSGLTIAASGLLLVLTRRRWWSPIVAVAIPLALQPLSYLPVTERPVPDDAPRVRVVQPNIGQENRSDDDGERVFRSLATLSGSPRRYPRLVVWPEGVLRDYVEDGYPWEAYREPAAVTRARIAALLGPRDVLMTGGDALVFDADARLVGAANAVFAIDARERLGQRYDKAHLVPYGEYLPVPWLLKPLGLARLVPGDLDFTPGPGPRTIVLPVFGGVGVQTCYEIIFSGQVVDAAHRPRVLFNPSNDAWFGRWGPPQHLAQARMRAIEEGLPIIRATPTGISAVIAADGRIVASVAHRTRGAIEVPIPPAFPPTPFARVGNAMAAIVAVVLVALAVALRLTVALGRRRR